MTQHLDHIKVRDIDIAEQLRFINAKADGVLHIVNGIVDIATIMPSSTLVNWGGISGTLSDQVDLQAILDAKQPYDDNLTQVAGLSPNNDNFMQFKHNAWTHRTPSEVILDLLPDQTGNSGKVLGTDGSALSWVTGGGGTWGSITGTLSSQTDLQSALDSKAPLVSPSFTTPSLGVATATSINGASIVSGTLNGSVTGVNTGDQDLSGLVVKNASITGATKTKITYDSKGLVTAGADATTADIADSLDKRYVTDANLVTIGNQSGVNTGDNAVNSLYSGLATSKQDTLVSGTNIKTVNSTSLLGSGNLAVGDMLLGTAQTVTSAKTFNDGTLVLNNVAGTFTGQLTNTNTANRTYTLPDATGTIALTSNITASAVGLGNVDNTSDATKNSAIATLTNKTISGASNTLSDIGNSSLTNSSVTIGSTSVSLGATAATIAGLTLTTPVLGVATATSINKVAITTPATGSTLTIADGKTLTASNTLTFSGTDGSTLNVGTGGTLGTAAFTASTAYAASSHTHAQSDVTNLVADLAAKAPQSTTYTKTEVDSLVAGAGGSPSFTAYENLTAGDVVTGFNDSGAFKVRKLITEQSYTRNTSVTWAQYSFIRMKGTTGDFIVFNGSSSTTYGLRAYSTASNGTITQGTGVTIAMTLGSAQLFDVVWCENRSVFVAVYKVNSSDFRIRTFSVSGTTITLNTEYNITLAGGANPSLISLCYNPSTSTLYFSHTDSNGYFAILPITVNADNTFTQGTATAITSIAPNYLSTTWDSVNNAVAYVIYPSSGVNIGFATYTGLTYLLSGYQYYGAFTLGNVQRVFIRYIGGGLSVVSLSTNNSADVLAVVKMNTKSTSNYGAVLSLLYMPLSSSTGDWTYLDVNNTNGLISYHITGANNGNTYLLKLNGHNLVIVKSVAHNQYESGSAMTYNYVVQDKSQPCRLIYGYSNSVLAIDVNNGFDFIGIAQETKTAGSACKVATRGNKSTIHSSLTPNLKYFIASNNAIDTNPSPAPLGLAVSATEILVGA